MTGLVAEFLAGRGILLNWDFLVDVPFYNLLPELDVLGVPEELWPHDDLSLIHI